MPAPSISEAAILPCKERSRASICLLASRLLDAIPETYIGDNLSASQPRQTSGIVGRPYDACVHCRRLRNVLNAVAARAAPTRPSGAGMHAIGGSRRHATAQFARLMHWWSPDWS